MFTLLSEKLPSSQMNDLASLSTHGPPHAPFFKMLLLAFSAYNSTGCFCFSPKDYSLCAPLFISKSS